MRPKWPPLCMIYPMRLQWTNIFSLNNQDHIGWSAAEAPSAPHSEAFSLLDYRYNIVSPEPKFDTLPSFQQILAREVYAYVTLWLMENSILPSSRVALPSNRMVAKQCWFEAELGLPISTTVRYFLVIKLSYWGYDVGLTSRVVYYMYTRCLIFQILFWVGFHFSARRL